MQAEGWYVDPYGAHEARWFSDGKPTSLVRDGQEESTDAPPDPSFDGPLEEVAAGSPADGEDLRRVDDGGGPPDYGDGALEGFGGSFSNG